jgi:hypothetical protein
MVGKSALALQPQLPTVQLCAGNDDGGKHRLLIRANQHKRADKE